MASKISDEELAASIRDVTDTRYVTHTRLGTYAKIFFYITNGGELPRAIGYLKRLGWYVVEMRGKKAEVIYSEYDDHQNHPPPQEA